MAAKKNSNNNPEEYVKNYQLEIFENKIDTLIKSVDDIKAQYAIILELIRERPTKDEVEARVKAAELDAEKNLNDAIEKQDLKYSPVVKTNKTLLGLLLTSGVGIIGTLIMLVLTIGSR